MNGTISENLSNTKNRDINIPLSPASFSKRTDGKWEYICGNCSYCFEEAPRCPECGQLLKKNIDIDYKGLLDKLSACNNKLGLVETLKEYGIRTTTKSEETVTVDDQYFQLEDGSRIQFYTEKIKLWTNIKVSKSEYFKEYRFKDISYDGKYRNQTLIIDKTPDNLKFFLEYFLQFAENRY